MEGLVFLGVMILLVKIALHFIDRASRFEAGAQVECDECRLFFRKTYMTEFQRDEDLFMLEGIHANHKGLTVEIWEWYRDA